MTDDSVSQTLSFSSNGSEDDVNTEGVSQDSQQNNGPSYNILLLGDSGVGKTDLIQRLTLGNNDFKAKFQATIGMTIESRILDIDGTITRLQIWDPSGSQRFRSLISKYVPAADGILFVFDLNYRKSFQNIQDWLRETEQYIRPELVGRMVVGNKCDIPPGESRVSDEEIMKFVNAHGTKYLYTSGVSGENVHLAFITLCQEIQKKKEDVSA